MDTLLEIKEVSKSFGKFEALRGVSLSLRPGSVHAVLGENGAGKSTLMKIISGVFAPSSGEVCFRGQPVSWKNAEAAQAAGISTIFQEFILLPNLSVSENLFLGREIRKSCGRLDEREMLRRSRALLEGLHLRIDPEVLTGTLRVADQQMVEIAKGVMRDADVFIFDEPTAALGDREAEELFALVRKLRDQGKGVLYISHRLPELFALCDEVTVLKDGRYVDIFPIASVSPSELVAAMVGRQLDQLYPDRSTIPDHEQQDSIIMEGLSTSQLEGPINLKIRSHEIVGLAGLEGQGQLGITRAIFEGHKVTNGKLTIFGHASNGGSPADAIAAGIGLIPEDRKVEGLYPTLGVGTNIAAALLPQRPMARGALYPREKIDGLVSSLRIRMESLSQPIARLSGGNQQKALLARMLLRGVKLLICEEPTRGVDIGAKAEIYAELRALANSGVPVLVTSRELPELIGLCDRIIVLRDGKNVGEVSGISATEESVMHMAVAEEAA